MNGFGIRGLRRAERFLDDAVLGFFALASLFLIFVPSVFDLTPRGEEVVRAVEYAIIGLFAVEYLIGLALAPCRRTFLLDPWRLVDMLIIMAALVALVPAVPEVLRNSPVLRILRLGRVALLGTRSGLALTDPSGAETISADREGSIPRLRALGEQGEDFVEITWEEGLARIRNADPAWLFVSGVGLDRLPDVAAALGVPLKALEALFSSSVPRFDRLARFSALFARYPLPIQEDAVLRRTPVLLIGSADNVVVLSRDRCELEDRVEAALGQLDERVPRLARATIALLDEFVRAYSDIVEWLEVRLLRAETEQATLRDEAFLERTSELRSDILRVRRSLRHLKNEMRDTSFAELVPTTADTSASELLHPLGEGMDDLFEGVEDLRESLQALMDLRLNVSSFQMNRVMRLLALLTALALIPATAGGLLGMNLLDAPWSGTLPQVAFGVAAGMALSLYVFAIKGWMR